MAVRCSRQSRSWYFRLCAPICHLWNRKSLVFVSWSSRTSVLAYSDDDRMIVYMYFRHMQAQKRLSSSNMHCHTEKLCAWCKSNASLSVAPLTWSSFKFWCGVLVSHLKNQAYSIIKACASAPNLFHVFRRRRMDADIEAICKENATWQWVAPNLCLQSISYGISRMSFFLTMFFFAFTSQEFKPQLAWLVKISPWLRYA